MLRLLECAAGYAGRRVLDDVSLEVADGGSACVIGPSGCGKTTLLWITAGLLRPWQGTVRLDGSEIAAGDRRVGLIPQHYGLFPWFTVRQNVSLGLRLQGARGPELERAADLELERVGLADCSGRYPFQLSGGQQQRVAIARSFALSPRLLLMDEPFSALDALTRESLQDMLLARLRGNRLTVLMVTHSIEEAVYLGGSVFVLEGQPARIAARFDNPGQGSDGWRSDPEFFRLCTAIRARMGSGRVV
jgi:ABC-type nitrate/sulfonate/bicarbonate transport system ATPase subunit